MFTVRLPTLPLSALTACCAWVLACGPTTLNDVVSECDQGDSKCVGDTPYVCAQQYKVPGLRWEAKPSCDGGRVCVVGATQGARCAESAGASQACGTRTPNVFGEEEACDNDDRVICVDRYIVARDKCRSCTRPATSEAPVRCDGGLDAPCSVAGDCADGLSCLAPSDAPATKRCTIPCPADRRCTSPAFESRPSLVVHCTEGRELCTLSL